MLARRIIPCLDVKDGRVVKGVNFRNLQDAGDPVETAEIYDRAGADEITFLDITASHEKRKTIIDVVEQTAANIFIPLTVGGGVRTLEDIKALLRAGADKVSINTAAVNDPLFVRRASGVFGSQCIVVAVDAKRVSSEGETGKWEVFTHGGRNPTGIDTLSWVEKMAEFGAGEILLTSMDRDGTKAGYDIPLNREVSKRVNIPVIASGGAGELAHLYDVLTDGHADAVLAASIFHYGRFSVSETKEYLKNRGVTVRI